MDLSTPLLGTYVSEAETVDKGGKIIKINYDTSSIFPTFDFNLSGKLGKINLDFSISLGVKKGINLKLGASWNYKGTFHTIKGNTGMNGGGIEWGTGKKDKYDGNGFRFGIKPWETLDGYSFDIEKENDITRRSEQGWYVNSGLIEAAVLCCIFAPEIFALIVGVAGGSAVGTGVLQNILVLVIGLLGVETMKNCDEGRQ